MISIDALRVKEGQEWTLQLWNKLLQAVQERTIRSGRYVRLHHTPDGVIVNANPTSNLSVSYPWQMSVDVLDDTSVKVSFLRGLINTIEPKIRDVSTQVLTFISQVDKAGNLPALKIDSFTKGGFALVYAKCTLNKLAGSVDSIEIISSADYQNPDFKNWIAYKLIGVIFYSNGTLAFEQHAFFDLSLVIAKGSSGNGFTPIWGVAG